MPITMEMVIPLICLMAERVSRIQIHPYNYLQLLRVLNRTLRILDNFNSYHSIYTIENCMNLDVIDVDQRRYGDSILIESAKLQSFVERLEHIIEYNHGKFDS